MSESSDKLDVILKGLNDANTSSRMSSLLSPEEQMSVLSKYSGSSVCDPREIGQCLYNLPPRANAQFDDSFFIRNYLSKRQALDDFSTISSSFDQCQVFPPLLLRYNGHKDLSVFVSIKENGALRRAKKDPDMILHFHRFSKAITMGLCATDPERSTDFLIVVTTLYSLVGDSVSDVKEFVYRYDANRIDVVAQLKIKPLQ